MVIVLEILSHNHYSPFRKRETEQKKLHKVATDNNKSEFP